MKFESESGRSWLGWPHFARLEMFKNKFAENSAATHRITFQAKAMDLRIIRVPIDLPKYRMANGRTASAQEECIATTPNLRPDIFSGDPELWDAQEKQHELLMKLVNEEGLNDRFEDEQNHQVEPLLLDENGFVVNGNRRLASWRELLRKQPDRYAHFRHIDVVVLPHCDEKDLDRLEASLQVEKDIRADYSWHAQAAMMLSKRNKYNFSDRDLAEMYKMKEKEVAELFEMRLYAAEYLQSRNRHNEWSVVSGDEFAFRKIVSNREKISTVGKQEVFKLAAYALIDNPEETGERLYSAIPQIVGCIDKVCQKLQEAFDIKPADRDSALENIFGDEHEILPTAADNVLPLAREIQQPANSAKARAVVVEVLRAERELLKDAKTAGYLLDCVAKAHSLLRNAVSNGLRPESTLNGVEIHLSDIEARVREIRDFIAPNARN